MEVAQVIESYGRLSRARQVSFLAALALELTVPARETHVAGSEDVGDPRRLRALNEIQHAVPRSAAGPAARPQAGGRV